jgi:hypothetical protein
MEDKDLENFKLPEENFTLSKEKYDGLEVKTSLEELENYDFSSDKEFKLDEYYEMVHMLDKSLNPPEEKKDALRALEAENVIKNDSEKYIGKEATDHYEKQRLNLVAFLHKYEVNSELVKNMSEDDKNKIFDIGGFLFNDYQKIHNNLDFIFPVTFEEHRFIQDVIFKKLEYDRDGVFQARELTKNYLKNYTKFVKDSPEISDMNTRLDINSMMILYHHLTRYKIKGYQTEAGLFVSLITKLEERLMLYNAYKIITERLSQQFQVWGGALTIDDIGLKVTDESNQTELKVVDEMTGKEK